MKILWLTDIHLDFLTSKEFETFINSLVQEEADSIFISGDIANANSIEFVLKTMAVRIQIPIYFVLGNHDFYHSSISKVREKIKLLCDSISNLHYLTFNSIVKLNSKTALIGHDGWGDGRLGDYNNSQVLLNDFNYIEELKSLKKSSALGILNKLGNQSAIHFESYLPKALNQFNHVIVLTHVPPFKEAAWHEGEFCDDNWLPFFSNKSLGDVLYKNMLNHPDRKMTILCGHTHSSGKSKILNNLFTITGEAKYFNPVIQSIINI